MECIPDEFMSMAPTSRRRMAYLCQILVEEYQQATVEVVVAHVKAEAKSAAGSSGSALCIIHSGSRRDAVIAWSRLEHPLSYDSNLIPIQHLAKALTVWGSQTAPQVPWSTSPDKISIEEFAGLIFSMGDHQTRASLSPPLFRHGTLPETVAVVIRMFKEVLALKSAGIDSQKTVKSVFIGYMRWACNTKRINFGMWSEGGFPSDGKTRGRIVDRLTVPTRWIGFGKVPPPNGTPTGQLLLTSEEANNNTAGWLQETILTDIRAQWTAAHVRYIDIGIYFARTINPVDFSATAAGIMDGKSTPFLVKCFDWANNEFQIHNKAHHLFLINAILYSKACPDLFWPQNAAEILSKPDYLPDPVENRQIAAIGHRVCELEWIDGITKRRQFRQRETLIPLFVLFCLLNYSKGSPIANHDLVTVSDRKTLSGKFMSKRPISLA